MGLITLKQHPKLQPTSSPITWVSTIFSTPTQFIRDNYFQQELVAELTGTSVSTLKDELLKRIDGDSYIMGEIEA